MQVLGCVLLCYSKLSYVWRIFSAAIEGCLTCCLFCCEDSVQTSAASFFGSISSEQPEMDVGRYYQLVLVQSFSMPTVRSVCRVRIGIVIYLQKWSLFWGKKKRIQVVLPQDTCHLNYFCLLGVNLSSAEYWCCPFQRF